MKGRKAKIVKGKIIKDPKVRGEWVESVFMARAGEEGLTVSKPWGDSKTFDFVVGHSGHFVSVQVKSTTVFFHCGYPLHVRRREKKRYARGSFDFLAGYVIPEDAWYIIPAGKFAGIARLTLCSAADGAHWEEYREAWHLLREAVGLHKKDDPKPANETARPEEKSGFPTSVFGRVQAAMNFCRKQMQVPGTARDQGEDGGDEEN